MQEARRIISGNIAKRQKTLDEMSNMVQKANLTPRDTVQVRAAIDREKHAIEALNNVLAEIGLCEVLTSD